MKVAYLAPEIPALSATFVYKEIQTLESMGVDVLPFSIHKPVNEASEKTLDALKAKTVYVYQLAAMTIFLLHLKLLVQNPIRYLTAFFMLLSDMFRLGIVSRKALGLVYRFFYAAKIAVDMKQQKCSHLHVHFAHVPTDVAMYAAKLAGISYSVTAHANDLFERGWLLKQKVERSGFFATISEFNKGFLAQQGINTDKVRIVRCGVDEAQFSPRAVSSNNACFKIGVVGRLVEKKGIDTLIQAMSLLSESNIEAQLMIAGSGPLESDLKQQKSQLGLSDKQVQFIGALPNTEVVDFVKSLDVFALPCQQDANGDMDGIPVVLMEAMLSGVPVISTYLSGIPELVINQETGLLVQPRDASALAQAINQMMVDKEGSQARVDKAIDKVRKEFSIHINSNRLKQLFSDVSSVTEH